MKLHINDEIHEFAELDPGIPLLWVLRDHLNLTGTKYGCGIGSCGACTVLINGEPFSSCLVPAASLEGKTITTIEGLSEQSNHPVQRAWIDEQVPQCGYCQSGQILIAVAFLESGEPPEDEAIDGYFSRMICRCGTYPRIRKAIKRAAGYVEEDS